MLAQKYSCNLMGREMSVPGHALRCGPETSVTSPLRWLWFELRDTPRQISSRRGRGNVGIPQGFPKSVGRVESRVHGFPCFPYSVISMACFLRGAAIMHPCEVRSPTPARSGLAPLGGDLRCQLEPKRATFRKQKDESNCWLIGDAPRGL